MDDLLKFDNIFHKTIKDKKTMVIVVKLKNSDTEFHLINFTESNNPNKPYAYLLNVENNGFRRELWDNVKFFCYLDEKGHRYDAEMNKIKPSKTR